MNVLSAFAAGLVFGVGLILSGMTDPGKVIGFLDLAGSLENGVGWGLAGFCPGPALVSFGSGVRQAAVFVAAMLLGMLVYTAAQRLARRPVERAT